MNLKVLECSSCKKLHLPPAYFCPSCRSGELEEREISGRGVLYTYSTVHVPVPMLEKEAPYTLAIVELAEGCRVTGRMISAHPEKLARCSSRNKRDKGRGLLFRFLRRELYVNAINYLSVFAVQIRGW
ncbi:MAG TPA: OB-fold domain-containing protein [Thermodesulfobacteriota bacterium]|nr:OB-fold domain-containing protein [Thermodesulfobacteriota bacterium]